MMQQMIKAKEKANEIMEKRRAGMDAPAEKAGEKGMF